MLLLQVPCQLLDFHIGQFARAHSPDPLPLPSQILPLLPQVCSQTLVHVVDAFLLTDLCPIVRIKLPQRLQRLAVAVGDHGNVTEANFFGPEMYNKVNT